MPNLTTASGNVAIGTGGADSRNTTGSENIAIGYHALTSNTGGTTTSPPAPRRSQSNTTGTNNVASGYQALLANTSGNQNVATGSPRSPLQHRRQRQRRDRLPGAATNTTGPTTPRPASARSTHEHRRPRQRRHRAQRRSSANTTGDRQRRDRQRRALFDQHRPATTTPRPALGALSATPPATTTPRSAPAPGKNLTTGSDNVDIANAGKAGESGAIRIGTKGNQTRTFIAGISGKTIGGTAQPVLVNARVSSGRRPRRSASTASLAATVERLQRQIERLREQVKGG